MQWDNSFYRRRRRRRRLEFDEIVEIVASGREKICQKDINSELFSLWEAGLITDKNGKYKDGVVFEDEDMPGFKKPKHRRILKIMG